MDTDKQTLMEQRDLLLKLVGEIYDLCKFSTSAELTVSALLIALGPVIGKDKMAVTSETFVTSVTK